jgi:putative ABC transport system permease protein
VATNHNLAATLNLDIKSGEWFSDEESDRSWVVLGEKLASGILGTDQAMGQEISIKGKTFTVIGIIKNTDQPISLAGVDVDKAAFISMQNGIKFTGGMQQIGQIVIRPKSQNAATSLSASINNILKKNHSDDSEFAVRRANDVASSMSGWLSTITTAALIFASISLLVGGIGIMNIMLVSVTERIREIGIRKAVGATRRQVLEQFLLEALIMTFSGGVIGLFLSYLAGYLISLQFSLPLVFSWPIFAVGLGVPMIVGLIFGLWPAIRAARQDPIVALRQYQ